MADPLSKRPLGVTPRRAETDGSRNCRNSRRKVRNSDRHFARRILTNPDRMEYSLACHIYARPPFVALTADMLLQVFAFCNIHSAVVRPVKFVEDMDEVGGLSVPDGLRL